MIMNTTCPKREDVQTMTMTVTHPGKVIQQMSGDLALRTSVLGHDPVEEESVEHVSLAEARKTLVTL